MKVLTELLKFAKDVVKTEQETLVEEDIGRGKAVNRHCMLTPYRRPKMTPLLC